MKLLGNIITALICLTSFGFFFVSLIVVASHTNWKAIAMENKDKADAFRNDRDRALENIARIQSQLQRQQVAAATEIAYLKTQLAAKESERNTQKSRADKAETNLGVTTENLKRTQQLLQKKNSDNEDLQKQIVALSQKVSTQADRLVKLASDLEQAELILARSEQQMKQQMVEFNRLNDVAKANGLDQFSNLTVIPPDLRGRVTGVSPSQKGVFSLSLGEDDGLRNGRHIGAAQIIEAKANNSTARFLRGRQNEPAQLNDRVTTELSKKFSLERSNVSAK